MKPTKTTPALLFASVSVIFAIILVSSAASASASIITIPTTTYTVADDAYHYPSIADQVNSSIYMEWWYFEAKDTNLGLDFYTFYEIDDPGFTNSPEGLVPGAWVGSAIMVDDTKLDSGTTKVDYGAYSFSTETLDVQIASGNSITAINDDTIRIVGNDIQTGITWDLVFARDVVPQFDIILAQAGYLPGDYMGYIIYMPVATVTGTIIANGTTYAVNGDGYHDHNWGDPQTLNYNPWARTHVNFASEGYNVYISGGEIPRMAGLGQAGAGGLSSVNAEFWWVNVNGQWLTVKDTNCLVKSTGVDPYTGMEYVTRWSVTITCVEGIKFKFDIVDAGYDYWSTLDTSVAIPTLFLKMPNAQFVGTMVVFNSFHGWNPNQQSLAFDVLGSVEQSVVLI